MTDTKGSSTRAKAATATVDAEMTNISTTNVDSSKKPTTNTASAKTSKAPTASKKTTPAAKKAPAPTKKKTPAKTTEASDLTKQAAATEQTKSATQANTNAASKSSAKSPAKTAQKATAKASVKTAPKTTASANAAPRTTPNDATTDVTQISSDTTKSTDAAAPKTATKTPAKATAKKAPVRGTTKAPAAAKSSAKTATAKASAQPAVAESATSPQSAPAATSAQETSTSAASEQKPAQSRGRGQRPTSRPKQSAKTTSTEAELTRAEATGTNVTNTQPAQPSAAQPQDISVSVAASTSSDRAEKAIAAATEKRNATAQQRRKGQTKKEIAAVETDEQALLQTLTQKEVPPAPLSTPAVEEQAATLAENKEESDTLEGDAAQPDRKRKNRSRRNRNKKKYTEENSAQAADQAAEEIASEVDQHPENSADDSTDADDTTGANDSVERQAKQTKQEATAQKTARRKMFVSIVPEEQIEVVLTEEGQVQEYYVDMLHQAKTKGNIYKGVIHNVDPNLQAAFVNYGANKNGFLQIDEVHPEYYSNPHDSNKGRKYPPIQRVLKTGQEVLVQVVKEPAGTKGAFLTTYLSLPGRFLVLTPGREQIGVSRKVDNETERTRLREMLDKLNPGPGLGVIVRTVSMGASLENLQSDLAFLQRAWMEVRTKGTTADAPSLVYQEFDLATRAVRDYLTDQVIEVWVDDEDAADSITDLANNLFPRKKNLVRLHKEASTLFERFNLQKQLTEIHSREVSLPSGGRLVIDPTEALTAIDINSGRSSGKSNFEDMAYRTNMDAAKMIPLQLRLRDIGGQVVVDFIEMRDKGHWRDVEKTVRQGMKNDRARYDVGKISSFGMMEIVRQRLGSSALSVSTEPCPHCKGTGVRRNLEWQSQQALRDIARLLRAAQNQEEKQVIFETDPALALHLLNSKRQRLLEMEQNLGVQLEIRFKQPDIE